MWFPQGASDFTLIGLGDIVLPGLLVSAECRPFTRHPSHITHHTPHITRHTSPMAGCLCFAGRSHHPEHPLPIWRILFLRHVRLYDFVTRFRVIFDCENVTCDAGVDIVSGCWSVRCDTQPPSSLAEHSKLNPKTPYTHVLPGRCGLSSCRPASHDISGAMHQQQQQQQQQQQHCPRIG